MQVVAPIYIFSREDIEVHIHRLNFNIKFHKCNIMLILISACLSPGLTLSEKPSLMILHVHS